MRCGGGASTSGSSCSCFGGDRGLDSLTAFKPPLGERRMERFSGVSDSPERRRGLACLRRGCGLAGLAGGEGAGGVVCTGLRASGVGGGERACSSRSWSASPRTCSDSPARITVPSCSWATDTSPRYIKSTTA